MTEDQEKIAKEKQQAAAWAAAMGAGTGCLKMIAGFLLFPLAMAWHGYVFVTLWDWFMVPLVHFTLNIYYGFGVIITARFVAQPSSGAQSQGKTAIINTFLGPLVILAGGWFWHWLQWGM